MKIRYINDWEGIDWFTIHFLPRLSLWSEGTNFDRGWCLEFGWLIWNVQVWWWTK